MQDAAWRRAKNARYSPLGRAARQLAGGVGLVVRMQSPGNNCAVDSTDSRGKDCRFAATVQFQGATQGGRVNVGASLLNFDTAYIECL